MTAPERATTAAGDAPPPPGGWLDRPWAFAAMVAAATAIGAVLRLHRLGEPSFWVDEFFTIGRVGAEDLHWTNVVGHLPTHLSLWWSGARLAEVSLQNVEQWPALGVTESAARLGACWVGILTAPILALLARPVVGSGVAGATALLVAIVPYHLYWSQMARYYTLEFLFASAFVLWLARGTQTGRLLPMALAVAAGWLAFLSHFTAILVVGACLPGLVLAWWLRAPIRHPWLGVKTVAATVLACALTLLAKELDASADGSLGSFSEQAWDPSAATLLLGIVLRFEPVICVTGLAWLWVAVRRKDPVAIVVGAVATLGPAGVLALKALFPVGPRYLFACLFAWTLLAGAWSVEVSRRVGASAGGIVGASGLAILLVAVGFNAFVYARDGAGGRARWREAYAYVREHGGPDTPVYVTGGKFQARYYLGREAQRFPKPEQLATLAPGTFVIHRTQGTQVPRYADRLDVRARFEIPSKPWSYVLNVMRVPEP